MNFKKRSLRELGELIVGNPPYFKYRSSHYITEFFEECDLDFVHDGSTRAVWAANRIEELLNDPQPGPYELPTRFVHVLRTLMQKSDAEDESRDRVNALAALNDPLSREGFEAYYGEDSQLYVRHVGTKTVSSANNPHRPLSQAEMERRKHLSKYLDDCSEDELIEEILLPLFRRLGFQRISAAGHEDKALEYGKDVWMRYVLPSQHVLYFGIQAKKGKLDSAGRSKSANTNIADIYNQVLMMLGHEIFDPETSRRVLVDHAFVIAGGDITKQAKNWLGNKLDATKRSQILFMDRDDILNLFIVNALPLPDGAEPTSDQWDDDLPF